jgi:hypothetical protein
VAVAPTQLEVVVHAHDAGPGTGHRIRFEKGALVGADKFASDVLDGMRRRHPGLSDAKLVGVIDGWSNGYVGIRPLPADTPVRGGP